MSQSSPGHLILSTIRTLLITVLKLFGICIAWALKICSTILKILSEFTFKLIEK